MIERHNKWTDDSSINTFSVKQRWSRQPMAPRTKLAMDAMSEAIQLRQSQKLGIWSPICPYDLVEKIGVKVWFEEYRSMEGMYCKKPGPLIVISSLRPSGRQAYTCTHELGHHTFKHGTHIDNLIISHPPQ